MKKIIFSLAVCFAFFACTQSDSNSGATNEMTHDIETREISVSEGAFYGEKIDENNVVDTQALLTALETEDSIQIKVKSAIEATCQMKGCWMDVALENGETMKVTFQDYGFFVPKEGMEGKETIIEGYAKTVETDVETLKHYAKDAGKSEDEIAMITSPKKEIAFVATGVIIKDGLK